MFKLGSYRKNLITQPRMGPSQGFVTGVFFFVLSSVTYYGLFYCIIRFVLHHWRLYFSIRFEFQVKSCFRKTLCGLPWNVTRDVGWTLGELSGSGWSVKLAEVSVSVDLFLQCPSQVGTESSLSLVRRLVRIGKKVVITELGDWDMRAEHKQYIFKAITKTFDKPESLAISTISQKHLYQRFIKVN